jgi:predicted PurR-regulated permease PerM
LLRATGGGSLVFCRRKATRVLDRSSLQDLPRITLGVLSIGVLTAASVWVLWPFAAALVWATTVVVATWPVLLLVQAWLGGRRGFAVAVMIFAFLALLVIPVWLAVFTIADNAERMVNLARSLRTEGLPPPPAWVEGVPLVGQRVAGAWRSLAGDAVSLAARVGPHLGEATRWLASRAGSLGATMVQLILTVAISGVLYAKGETGARGVQRFLRRLAGERGENVAHLAAKAVRAVALGIVVTALAQTVLSAIGLIVSGVPYAAALTAAAFILCIAQLGPLLVLGPATIWLYSSGSPGRGTVLLVFTIVAGTLDNFLRPVLIKRGADLPLLLILAGVIGGLLGFGIVGLFVGPVVLAVTWKLLESWVGELDRPSRPARGK